MQHNKAIFKVVHWIQDAMLEQEKKKKKTRTGHCVFGPMYSLLRFWNKKTQIVYCIAHTHTQEAELLGIRPES